MKQGATILFVFLTMYHSASAGDTCNMKLIHLEDSRSLVEEQAKVLLDYRQALREHTEARAVCKKTSQALNRTILKLKVEINVTG